MKLVEGLTQQIREKEQAMKPVEEEKSRFDQDVEQCNFSFIAQNEHIYEQILKLLDQTVEELKLKIEEGEIISD